MNPDTEEEKLQTEANNNCDFIFYCNYYFHFRVTLVYLFMLEDVSLCQVKH